MTTIRTIAIFALLGLAACNSQSADDTSAVSEVQERILPTEGKILAAVYDNSYQAPESFYLDERVNTAESYSLYHVKDSSLSYELCTDEFEEARTWEESDNQARSVSGAYVDSYENDRYFEFVRDLSFADGIGNIGDLTSPGFARVFKCSYVNRDGVDRNLVDGYSGKLNSRPLTKQSIKTYSEYMWQFTFFWPAQKTVLQTFTADENDKFKNTLVLAFKTNRGTEQCDLIEIVDWVFSVDKNSGNVTKHFNLLFELEAELVNGVPTKCN